MLGRYLYVTTPICIQLMPKSSVEEVQGDSSSQPTGKLIWKSKEVNNVK